MAFVFSDKYVHGFVSDAEIGAVEKEVSAAHRTLLDKSGAGADFLGWLELPKTYDRAELAAVKKAAEKIRGMCDVFVVIGIGGSYLGARAAVEFIHGSYYNNKKKNTPDIYFVGNDISSSHLKEILELCKGRDVCVNVISKSGTTTEPAIAFRIFRDLLIEKYGKEGAAERIFATTDKSRGALRSQADTYGYESFVIADDVGGRYSVLTAVGLLPIAVAGIDIDALMKGAADAREQYMSPELDKNDCYRYAAIRNILYRSGKKIEMMAAYEPDYTMMCEWFKQLFGESEGKEHKGIFPASAIFSTDLHSLGQYIQQGERSLFETVVTFAQPKRDFVIEATADNEDGLNFLAGKHMSEVNRKAFEGTVLAHTDGGVPNILLDVDKMDEYNLGWLIYFLEKACGISGYVLGVNPFDQPGVESYKLNMFALMGKPGYEERRAELENRINF